MTMTEEEVTLINATQEERPLWYAEDIRLAFILSRVTGERLEDVLKKVKDAGEDYLTRNV